MVGSMYNYGGKDVLWNTNETVLCKKKKIVDGD